MNCDNYMIRQISVFSENKPGRLAAMAKAFRLAIEAGRTAYLSGPGRVLDFKAEASSPLTGFLAD